ncbi:MAG: toxin co-regulated pilus biosynthesis Q family protein [bacterium]|nr:toxin co-regulated pilus biosynthesis Q family protein [bacterium]
MKKISKLSLVGLALISMVLSKPTLADWGVEAEENYYEEKEQVWPMPYTDTYSNIDALADVYPESENKTNSNTQAETGWTGGPSYTPPAGNPPVVEGIIPPADSNMPLANKELVVDDGVRVLSASMPPGYPTLVEYVETKEIVEETEDNRIVQDSVRDWIAKEGMTLREVLQQWADIEGWELVWNTKREYPLKASAIFRGRFKDVSAAIIRNFSRATPQPLAKFFLGNRVLVIKTLEENDAN